ncbi:MAG TPA: hypothetical protein VHF23_06215 [Gaiellaceae bacterium]|nr:hypothetical protein [Gaiellaceae bacterium]
MKRFLPIALAVVAAAFAALAVNLLLIGYASDRSDPVGNLSPRAPLVGERTTTTGAETDATTTEGTTSTEGDEDDDSGRGRGRNRGRGSDDDD